MRIAVIGAGNSGLAMAAHLSKEGHQVILWNRSLSTIEHLIQTKTIRCSGAITGNIPIYHVTNKMDEALFNVNLVFITTPATAHRDLAQSIALHCTSNLTVVLNPGRTFGALEFKQIFEAYQQHYQLQVAEAQTIIYTCRKIDDDGVNILALKNDILLSAIQSKDTMPIIQSLPDCLQEFYIPATSMIQTSIGNVGMILHCAPLLLNAGWTESSTNTYKYYYDGISPTISKFLEKIDEERITVSKKLGCPVESIVEWFRRTYHITGNTLYECIQNNVSYHTIDAPNSLQHRYIFEDVPCGLVPLESVGKMLGIDMSSTSLIIDLASKLLNTNFRAIGRTVQLFEFPEFVEPRKDASYVQSQP